MKKFIAALAVLFITSSSSINLWAQKTLRLPQTVNKTEASKTIEKTENQVPEITTAAAFSDGRGVLLKWQTSSEKNLIGFNIYKTDGRGNIPVNDHLILSSQIRNGKEFGTGSEYTHFDEAGSYQYSYFIEGVFTDGKRNLVKSLYPRYTNDLVNVSAMTSDAFRQSKASAEPVIYSTKLGLAPAGSKTETDASGLFADIDRQKWVAAQPGVKIAVSKEGFYRVTRAELEAAGFNVNTSSDLWQLYLNGEEQAIIAEEKGQYIEFYNPDLADTPESARQIYFLVAGPSSGRRIDQKYARRISGSVESTNYLQVQTKKERLYYIGSIRNGDNQNFFGTFIGDTPSTINFDLKGIDYSSSKTEITLVTQGLSQTPHLTKVVVNGEEFGTFSGTNQTSMTFTFGVPTQLLQEGTNTIQLTALGGSSDFSLFDSISVNLQRRYTADQDQLSFYTGNYKTTNIGGFTSPNIRVFDLTYRSEPTLLTGLNITENAGVYTVNIPSNRQRTLYAVADSAVRQVDSIVQNTPSTLSNAAHNGQLVIITHRNWLAEANTWADYRRAGNFSVEVVDVEDIYDEFSYGKTSSKSLSDFLQFAKNNWQTPPAYVLLMGDATYDPRNFTGLGDFNYVPTRMVDTVYTETGSDDALTDFNNDGLAEIPIGRLPVRSAAEVTHMLGKVTVFEQTVAQGFDRGAVCASDLPTGYDFGALCGRVFGELPASVAKTYVNRGDTDAAAVLLSNLNSGKYIVNYSGHGHTTVWAANSFFNSTAALNLANGNNLSVFTMLTCLNGYFIEPASYSLSENLLRAQNGGAVASWSSSGLTTPDVQEIMARRFYSQLGAGNMTRLGDLINDSKTVINGGRDVRLSWVLLGDPTLKVR